MGRGMVNGADKPTYFKMNLMLKRKIGDFGWFVDMSYTYEYIKFLKMNYYVDKMRVMRGVWYLIPIWTLYNSKYFCKE